MINELGDNLIPLTAIGLTFGFLVIWVVAATIDSVYKTHCNTRLKERLIARGVSAEDIDRIVKAGKPLPTGIAAQNEIRPVPPLKKQCVG
jgi:hypothetical protein